MDKKKSNRALEGKSSDSSDSEQNRAINTKVVTGLDKWIPQVMQLDSTEGQAWSSSHWWVVQTGSELEFLLGCRSHDQLITK